MYIYSWKKRIRFTIEIHLDDAYEFSNIKSDIFQEWPTEFKLTESYFVTSKFDSVGTLKLNHLSDAEDLLTMRKIVNCTII